MPDEPESGGLVALLLFQHSRREARTDPSGDVVTLEEQDRSRWNAAEIDQANTILDSVVRRDAIGPYQVQAFIAACHANAPHAAATDWARIVAMYERLLEVTANPLVKLNHAVAVGMARGPEDGLALVSRLEASGELRDTTSGTRLAQTSCVGWAGTPKPRTRTAKLSPLRAPRPNFVT